MIPFKGQLDFKQYMKDKPRDCSVGLCSRVVLDLMAGIENSGFELYTDNYYTSPELFLQVQSSFCISINRK